MTYIVLFLSPVLPLYITEIKICKASSNFHLTTTFKILKILNNIKVSIKIPNCLKSVKTEF